MNRDDVRATRPGILKPIDVGVVTLVSCACAILLLVECSSGVPPTEGPASRSVGRTTPPGPRRAAERDQAEEERIPEGLEQEIRAETAGKARQEAADRLAQLFRSSVAYHSMELVDPRTGKVLPPQFPSSGGPTPANGCCGSADKVCHSDPADWDAPTWLALNFAIDGPHYFQYEYVSSPTGFTARATADLDCDGVYSTYSRTGRVLQPSGDIQGDREMTVIDGDE